MWRRIAPAFALVFLAPFVGEFLLGNIPARMIFILPTLAPMYGCGALLIREVTRRTGRGWPTILALGLAYGVVEEGLADMSLFDPNFAGLHLLRDGNLFGIGWTWWFYVLTLHVVWSIGTSIGLAEALFTRRGNGPWLGRVGLTVTAIVFVLGVVAVHLTFAGKFQLQPWQALLSVGLAAAAVLAAFLLPRPNRAGQPGATLRPWLVLALVLVAAGVFQTVTRTLPGGWPIPVDVACYLAVAVPVALWSRRASWTPTHRLAVVAAGTATYCGIGFLLAPKNPIDLAGQAVVALIAIGLLVLAARKRVADRVADR